MRHLTETLKATNAAIRILNERRQTVKLSSKAEASRRRMIKGL